MINKHTTMKKKMRIFGVMAMVAISSLLMIKIAKAVEVPLVLPSTSPISGTADNQDVVFLPTVSVEDLKVDKSSGGEVSGTFAMHNYSDLLIGDLGYTVSLIDPAPKLEENSLVAESYQVYKEQTFLNVATLSPKEKKELPFKLELPTIPKGQYRIRVGINTSKNIGLGWDNVDNLTLGEDTGFIIVPMAWVAPTSDLKNKSYALDGANVDPNSDVTLGFGYVNKGTKSVTVKPHLNIFEAKTSNSKVSEQTGVQLPVVAPSKKIADGSMQIKAPEKPGSYTIYLDFVDENGKTVSSVSEYRLVVKGGSGKVVNAWFKELTATKAEIEASIVGPADDSSTLEATATVALIDGDKQVEEQTSTALKLSGEDGRIVSVNFGFDLKAALQDPGLKVTLKDTQGNVLDTYTYKVPAPKATVSAVVAQPLPTNSSKKSVGLLVLGIVIAILGVVGAIWALLRGHSGNKNNFTKIMMLMIVAGVGLVMINLPLANASYIFHTTETPGGGAAGAGNHYYFYGGRILAYVNKPNTVDQSKVVSRTVPIEFTLVWAKCTNNNAYGGIAIDYLNANSKIVPTVNNWAPFHGLEGARYLDYNGDLADKSNWSVKIGPTSYKGTYSTSDCGSKAGGDAVIGYSGRDTFCLAKKSWTGSFTVSGDNKFTTFRLTGYYVPHLIEYTRRWFGIYGWLNLLTTPVCTNPSTSAIVNQNVTLTASGGDDTIYLWPSLGVDGTKVSGSGNSVVLNYSTPGTKTVTVASGGLTGSCAVVVSSPTPTLSPTVTLTSDAPLISGIPTVTSGTPVNLNWSSANTSSCPTATNFTAAGTGSSGSGTDTPTNTGTSAITKTYTIACTGLDGTPKTGTTTVKINPPIIIPPLSLSCSATPLNVYTGSPVTFSVVGGSGNGYTWNLPASDGTNTASDPSNYTITATFSKPGNKNVTVLKGGPTSPSCNVNVSNRQVPGDIQEQ